MRRLQSVNQKVNQENSRLTKQVLTLRKEIQDLNLVKEKEANNARAKQNALNQGLKEKEKFIQETVYKEKWAFSQLGSKTQAMAEAYKQYQVSQQSLRDQVQRLKEENEKQRDELESVQEQLMSCKKKQMDAESQAKASAETINLYQNILKTKEEELYRSKVRMTESQSREKALQVGVAQLEQEVKALKLTYEREKLQTLKGIYSM